MEAPESMKDMDIYFRAFVVVVNCTWQEQTHGNNNVLEKPLWYTLKFSFKAHECSEIHIATSSLCHFFASTYPRSE